MIKNSIISYTRLLQLLIICVYSTALYSQNADLKLVDWKPVSQLVVKQTKLLKPKYPVIDMHDHLGHLENTAKYLEEMDKAGVWKCVSLDGRSANDFYKEHLQASQRVSKDRFLVFFAPDWAKIDEPDFGKKEVARLEEAVKMGVKGVKIFKVLGLTAKDKSGKVIPVDDPRIDPIWDKCAELHIPIVMHVGDPKAFFTPADQYNERYDELATHPAWSFYGSQFPDYKVILEQRNRVIAKHPKTTFIIAHVGNLAEDLGQVSAWLDKYPNFNVEIAARISELGRQPYTARRFMIKYQDRVFFGTDTPPDAEAYRVYFRFMETDDEYFDPAPSHHQQGRWMIYGLYLPDQVLEKIYNKNALRIFGMNKIK